MLGAGNLRMIVEVLLPASVPSIVAGLRVGAGLGWQSLVGAELIVASAGVGYMMVQGQRNISTADRHERHDRDRHRRAAHRRRAAALEAAVRRRRGWRGHGMSAIEFDSVGKALSQRAGQTFPALEDVELSTVADKEFVAHRRAVGLRQDHVPAHGGRASSSRPRAASRSAARRCTAPGPDRAVVFQQFALFPWKTVTREHRLRPAQQGHARGRARRSGSRGMIELMGLQGYETRIPAPALRRHAAARRDRARLRARSGRAADGRAVRRARRADARRHAGGADAAGARQSAHRAVHHARRRGGGVSRRSRRGDDAAAGAHQGDRRRRAVRASGEMGSATSASRK